MLSYYIRITNLYKIITNSAKLANRYHLIVKSNYKQLERVRNKKTILLGVRNKAIVSSDL